MNMKKISLLLILFSGFYFHSNAQNLASIFTNVDTLFMSGAAPGHISALNANVIPIVSSSPCVTPQLNYSVATQYQNGRVIAIGHEGLLANNNVNSNDNLTFLKNAIAWLNTGNKRVTLKQGWINNGNISTLKNALITDNYTFGTLSGNITQASLANTDVLILGNDWNGTQPYLASELSVLDTFVANGGSIFIAGLGWSWPQALNLYPMNAVANLFGIEYTTSTISDPTSSGAPKFYNFYPDNLNTSVTPYCPSPFVGINFQRGDNLRVLRLAVSTMGEFTQQSGGISATALLIDQWLEDINEMYGREYCVRFELIPTNNQLIFLDPATDPWGTLPAGSGGCTNANIILSQQATVIDNIIGAANYDISHVIAGSPFGGGCAGGFKSGLSGGLNIPVTRHEMGHQFSQSHTINHPNNNNYEPENGGWTVQGGNNHGNAHGASFHQLANFLANTVPNSGSKIPTGNTIPTVNAGADYVIPISTPFTLTGVANDPDANDSLTYVWDNMSLGIPQTIPVGDDSQGALFMRLLPDTSASRTFPKMSDVLANNNSNSQEQLPTQPRFMDIRLTVNDNHKILYNGNWITASGINSDDIRITVAAAGPFEVTSQDTQGIIYNGGSSQMVTWNVNGTDTLPINTQNVAISLSTDGGYTYSTLVPSTPNVGSAMVTLPNISTNSARIKVAAVNNIYFDVNTQNFEIAMSSSDKFQAFNRAVKLLPNPARTYFELKVPEELNYQVKIFDAKGALLVDKINTNYFDISNFSEGLYLIEITDIVANISITKKLIVVKK